MDVSKEETAFCVPGADRTVLARGKAASDPDALFEALKEPCLCPERSVIETGTLSGWLVRELGRRGLAVDGIDARQAHAVMKLPHDKTDAGAAELLAEIARTGFCRPVAVKSAAAQAARILLEARCHLVRRHPVRRRRDTQNAATASTNEAETTAVPRERKPRPRRDAGRGEPADLVARRLTLRDCA